MASKVVDIQIFGRYLKFNCPEEEISALNHAAEDLEQRLNELRNKSQVLNSDQIIITAALNIAYELTKARASQHEVNDLYTKRLQALQDTLESVLNNNNRRSISQK
ncbi:cell division protein ZapA [Utexia brackfieldae]|uniref:cell division protein ZapA n=1 Tax=Utexia brackfieldae TaxID=3074108 RepID=UPI00370DABA1